MPAPNLHSDDWWGRLGGKLDPLTKAPAGGYIYDCNQHGHTVRDYVPPNQASPYMQVTWHIPGHADFTTWIPVNHSSPDGIYNGYRKQTRLEWKNHPGGIPLWTQELVTYESWGQFLLAYNGNQPWVAPSLAINITERYNASAYDVNPLEIVRMELAPPDPPYFAQTRCSINQPFTPDPEQRDGRERWGRALAGFQNCRDTTPQLLPLWKRAGKRLGLDAYRMFMKVNMLRLGRGREVVNAPP